MSPAFLKKLNNYLSANWHNHLILSHYQQPANPLSAISTFSGKPLPPARPVLVPDKAKCKKLIYELYLKYNKVHPPFDIHKAMFEHILTEKMIDIETTQQICFEITKELFIHLLPGNCVRRSNDTYFAEKKPIEKWCYKCHRILSTAQFFRFSEWSRDNYQKKCILCSTKELTTNPTAIINIPAATQPAEPERNILDTLPPDPLAPLNQ